MTMREAPWHAMPVDRVREALGLPAAPSPDGLAHGLSEAEARARLAATGPNRFQAIRPVPLAAILLRQFTGTLILLLVVAAGISFATGDRLDALAILAVLLLNGLLGFVTEWRARRAMEGLLALDVGRARVRRDGHEEEVPADTLVPGDVILVEAGQTVPADARLISASGLAVLEAPLTGESVAVEKDAKAELPAETPLPARRTMLYKGTPIVTGRGEAMVVATGMATEVGRVGALAAEFGEDRTPLERRWPSCRLGSSHETDGSRSSALPHGWCNSPRTGLPARCPSSDRRPRHRQIRSPPAFPTRYCPPQA